MSTTTQPNPFSGKRAPKRGNGVRGLRGVDTQQRAKTTVFAASAASASSGTRVRGGLASSARGRGRVVAPGRGSTNAKANTPRSVASSTKTVTQSQDLNAGNKRSIASQFANAGLRPNQNVDHDRDVRRHNGGSFHKTRTISAGDFNARYEQLKVDRAAERTEAIAMGHMTDPNERTLLSQAITPVGTCTEMCPEFERVERIVQKMVDRAEKLDDGKSLHDKENRMIKRFRRSAAGYDEQLPSDIRTPATLLQTTNYLLRHVISLDEDNLGVIHKFVWDRTRSIRNDLSIQQLTQAEDVKVAVKCLERIARFHILSLHILSNPENTEHFDPHQEREQLNNTFMSLLYYYDDNRNHLYFPNEDEFRAYYIVFSISDQRPDLESRVQRWPRQLRESPRIKIALELFAAAGNTWEYQGTLDSKRPNPIAQNNYIRFFELIKSESTSYLMACIAEIYFNQIRQTAIRSIWKAYCRQPVSQQGKNHEWLVPELTAALHLDNDQQTIDFCEQQGLTLRTDGNGDLFLDWAQHPINSIADFQPFAEQVFSYRYVEAKRCGRTLVALILGMSVAQAVKHGLIDESLLYDEQNAEDQDGGLFVDSNLEQSAKAPLYPVDQEKPNFQFSPEAASFMPPSSTSGIQLLPAPEAQLLPRISISSGFGASPQPNLPTPYNPFGAAKPPGAMQPPSFGVPSKSPFAFAENIQQTLGTAPVVSQFPAFGAPQISTVAANESSLNNEKKLGDEQRAAEERTRAEREAAEKEAARKLAAEKKAAAREEALKAEAQQRAREALEKKRRDATEKQARLREIARREAEQAAAERRKEEERRDEEEKRLRAALEEERRERARLEREIKEAKLRERIRREEEEERQATQLYIMKQKEAEHKAQLEKERRLHDIEREIEEEIGGQINTYPRTGISLNESYTDGSPTEPPLIMEDLLGDQFSRSASSIPDSSISLPKAVIDEDEVLLSAARVAAQKLAGGRRWLSDYTTSLSHLTSAAASPSLRSSFGYGALNEHFRRGSDGSRISVNGFDVALAPEDHCLGHSLSRTEQRIRLTGAHGLASLPIETPRKSSDRFARENKRIRLD
ncbi:hypothetical protein KEM54_002477 [Ascosphaera aggregata]|nr:hypothetical protein KEM54_002477 [Ascosphaera aggregata]